MTVTTFHIQITESEYRQRCEKLRRYMDEEDLSGIVLFSSDYILYYCGFAFIPTERPLAFIMSREGERVMFVPRMEVEHAKANAMIDRIEHYHEYPDYPHPMQLLQNTLSQMAISGHLGSDNDGYLPIFGYRGAKLSSFGFSMYDVGRAVEDQMAIKSDAEIALIKESTRWANLALSVLKKHTIPGKTETQVVQLAQYEATNAMFDAIGPIYRAQGWQHEGAMAEYRGQIGRNSSIPHAMANNITFQAGDVLIAEAKARTWGYQTELERTFFMGQPTSEQKRFFEHMLNLQELAFEAIKPNVLCSDIDKAVLAYYETHDLLPYWRHHTGHGIGLRYHEGPFLDRGDDTILRAGMCFTIEPGLYSPELGGFRHSDTIVVTEDGIEIITYYPRDLQSMIID
jgi:Xaa-Pro dipeptidase